EGEMLREEIQAMLGLKDRKSFRERYLKPALEAGLIEMTLPDKPTSKVQRYRKSRGNLNI
ncbi:Fic family protein, partial [Vibrio cholerae]|nr:cell filamentation protein Fic [Vibrio cholerae]